ncbi:MAG: hypothetical protein VW338_00960 [Rhodospirillaceae bacterium]
MTARRTLRPAPERPALEALVAAAKQREMTPAEREAQQRSWVTGELMLGGITREKAAALYDGAQRRLRRLHAVRLIAAGVLATAVLAWVIATLVDIAGRLT